MSPRRLCWPCQERCVSLASHGTWCLSSSGTALSQSMQLFSILIHSGWLPRELPFREGAEAARRSATAPTPVIRLCDTWTSRGGRPCSRSSATAFAAPSPRRFLKSFRLATGISRATIRRMIALMPRSPMAFLEKFMLAQDSPALAVPAGKWVSSSLPIAAAQASAPASLSPRASWSTQKDFPSSDQVQMISGEPAASWLASAVACCDRLGTADRGGPLLRAWTSAIAPALPQAPGGVWG
mmetsp:Transcript_81331/g.213506  ORF Transcript_81331/g.213506 Transcript_81331/m.213506 type:complete len:240 (+) Transcript_81331:449-1168(+)